MFLGGYLKLALLSIRGAKWRSLLTMLGIVIGVVSVVTIVSLGEGAKQEVAQQINKRGGDLITILPGERVKRDSSGALSVDPLFNQNNLSFSDADFKIVQQVKEIKPVVPFGRVVGLVKTAERDYPAATVIATTGGVPEILNHPIEFGTFFGDEELSSNGAVLGRHVADELFQENAPLGKSFIVRDREFIVRGILEEFDIGGSLSPTENYNDAVFIPYKGGQEMMAGTIQIYQILAKPVEIKDTVATIDKITTTLKLGRAGQEDFAVLTQEESLALAQDVLTTLTNLITGIAAVSLVVGGIGIMNIMLVSVTERTKEIGIRKAVGATNRQILYQFMTEAAVLSLLGGFFGIILSIGANFVLRIFTDLRPVITLPVIGLAGAIALAVGIFFGAAPALKAARKDPILALRHE